MNVSLAKALIGGRLCVSSLVSAALGCGSGGSSRSSPTSMDATATSDAISAPTDSGGEGGDDSATDIDAYPADAGSSLTGTVVDFTTTRPLPARTVSIGNHTTTTDANGHFLLMGVPPAYDIMVIDPDVLSISIFKGLSRRDPVLPHKTLPTRAANRAILMGDVSGGGNYPLAATDSVDVYFFSDQADNRFSIGYGLPGGFRGPGYGPMYVDWNGTSSVRGHVMALGMFAGAGDAGQSPWFTDQPLTVMDGQMPFVNVALAQVMQTGQVAGTIQVPAGGRIVSKEAFYRLPLAHASLAIPVAQDVGPSFDDSVPDLTSAAGQLCVGADSTPGSTVTERCGLSLGQTSIVLTLEEPPSLLTPGPGVKIAKDTQFSWTPFSGGVHMLELEALIPTSGAPRIYVFTSATAVAWPDLTSSGVAFPATTKYNITIGGLGPYATMDEALGPNGIAARSPVELRRSYAYTNFVTTGP